MKKQNTKEQRIAEIREISEKTFYTREDILNSYINCDVLIEKAMCNGAIAMAAPAISVIDELTQALKLQPIETAPKDGTWILLFGGETDEDFDYDKEENIRENKNRICVGKWYTHLVRSEGWVIGFWDGMWFNQYINPTHWMPLPKLPIPPKNK